MLEAKNVNLVYPDGDKEKVVLDNISLKINDGESVVLVGPSGSGKSSMIYLLSALKKPTSGDIIFDNNIISSKKDTSGERYDSFGFIFQQHFLIPYLSVLENVLIAIKDSDTIEKSKEMLKKLGLEEHLNKKPHQLSGGQRQRVSIARALVKKPRVLFADEPTASLDHDTAVEVMSLIREMKDTTTLIMATHDTSLLEENDRVIVVNHHKLEEKIKA